MKNLDVKLIADYTEKTWFLGTNLLTETDWDLIEKEIGTSFTREEGAIFHVGVLDLFPKYYRELGYSEVFQEIMEEAKTRSYAWIFYDRDIDS
mgnify:CR=1 FL=1